MGEFPVMTPWGTFIINGSERVVVSQIIRSSGVFFSKNKDSKSGQIRFRTNHPYARSLIEFEMRSSDVWYAKLDRSKKIPLTSFIRALGVSKNKEIFELFFDESAPMSQYLINTFPKTKPLVKMTR